ncbi:hypothetical protein BDR04DRAFT_1118416 [Suillus decipiens]|nr:hypothetical protein BDR04DRAFT_1118416 [Suillus decipiens]
MIHGLLSSTPQHLKGLQVLLVKGYWIITAVKAKNYQLAMLWFGGAYDILFSKLGEAPQDCYQHIWPVMAISKCVVQCLDVLAASWVTWRPGSYFILIHKTVNSKLYYSINLIQILPHPSESSDAGNEESMEEHMPCKKCCPLFWCLKICANPNDPPEYTPEYLTLLQDASAQCKTPESPSPMKVDTLTISANYPKDLVEACWKAERERCDAKYKFQLQEVQKLPQA